MAKCFFTGVELPANEMYVLDTAAVRRALRDLQKRIAAVERLMLQLNVKDDAEVYNFRSHQSRTIKKFRGLPRCGYPRLISIAPLGQ